MNEDTVIELAREAGLADSPDEHNPYWTADDTETLERFAALVAAHEREECAKLMEAKADGVWANTCAAAIRSRT